MIETWILVMTLVGGGQTVPLSIPNLVTQEQCMEQGKYAESIAASTGVKVVWECKRGPSIEGEDDMPLENPEQSY